MAVDDVEHVESKSEAQPFGDLPWILDVCIHPASYRRTAQVPPAKDGYFALVLVGLLSDECGERNTGLDGYACAEDQALELAIRQHVESVRVQHMFAIAAQEPDTLLVSEQSECALGEVKERANTRVGLTVVVSKRTLIITAQLSDPVVDGERPAVAEGLVHFELHGLVFALRILVSVRLAVGVELATKCCAVTRLLTLSLAGAIWQ